MKFYKYHALGNDYIVLDPQDQPLDLTQDRIKIICHRNFGIGSDGILLGPLPSQKAPFSLRIFNPDGSEAEKSGNGLRIFCRYLWDRKLVDKQPFPIETKGGLVQCLVLDDREAGSGGDGPGQLLEPGYPRSRKAPGGPAGADHHQRDNLFFQRGNHRQPPLCHPSRRPYSGVGQKLWSSSGSSPAVPQSHQCSILKGAGSSQYPDRDLGAGGRLHPGFGQQQQRRRGRGPKARTSAIPPSPSICPAASFKSSSMKTSLLP